jgi:hypothetical protein
MAVRSLAPCGIMLRRLARVGLAEYHRLESEYPYRLLLKHELHSIKPLGLFK